VADERFVMCDVCFLVSHGFSAVYDTNIFTYAFVWVVDLNKAVLDGQ